MNKNDKNQRDIEKILLDFPQLKSKLFARGFLLTDAVINEQAYPFYDKWQSVSFGSYKIYTAESMCCYTANASDTAIALVGHAYNPFSMEYSDEAILAVLLEELAEGEESFWNTVNELTGVFTLFVIRDEALTVIGDASGMLTTFYTVYGGKTYISSHTNLIGDLLHLTWDPYVYELTHYHFFKLLGNSLPGDLTQFEEVKRLVPNHAATIQRNSVSIRRFYWPAKCGKSYDEIVDEAARLLSANLNLIAKKWERPAISLTGGCDSKTTLACAKDVYYSFSYFSYISSEAEKVDALAASKICAALALPHQIYAIPESDAELPDLKVVRAILFWNAGGICNTNPNDVRKRAFFSEVDDFDVEVKSWASEIGRAYYSKRFNGRADFGTAPTPRKCTTLYKFFLHNRRLVRKTDQVFERYLKTYFARAEKDPIEWQEQFFWEFRVPSWNGLVITGEHRYSFEITIPYNNRRLLELFLSVPIEDRIGDNVYKEIRNKMNPSIDRTGIAVTNLKHTKNRERAEDLYYRLFNRGRC